MKLVIGYITLVAIVQQATASWPCSAPCGSRCIPVPYNYRSCSGGCGFDTEETLPSCRDRDAKCVPLVVRPQEVPKPVLPVGAALLHPVPGPCAIRKAIVKPAVLQRPQCRPQHQHSGYSSCSSSCNSNNHFQSLSSFTSFGSGGGSSPPLDCRPILYGGVPPPTGNCAVNQAHCAPADAVSIALAYQKALEDKREHDFSEDRLQFGFRKLPQELPQRKVVKNNIPEEKIFALNGQIVELKPVKIASQKSLDEEAAEELLALEEDEERVAEHIPPVRKVSLGEIGYGPAKIKNPTFVDVPVGNIVATAVDAVGDVVSEALHGGGCGGSNPSCKVISGNVVYKTVPKKEQCCLPVRPEPDSCESAEIEQEDLLPPQDTCTCSCVPVVFKKTHSHHSQCHKKSSITVQKLCH